MSYRVGGHLTGEENEIIELLKKFANTLAKFSKTLSELDILLPAIITITGEYMISQLDDARDGYEDRKAMIRTFEGLTIGGWILKNSSSIAGEGSAIALMGMSVWSDKIGDVLSDAADKANEGLRLTNEEIQKRVKNLGGIFNLLPPTP